MLKKRIFFEDDKVQIRLEERDGALFVHCLFHEVSKASVKWLQEIWPILRERVYFAGYANIFSYTKDLRVVKLFPGWELVEEIKDEYGNDWKVVRWELN